MKKISVFDTAIASENCGDFIIMEAVNQELKNMFSNDMFFFLQTHDVISIQSYKINRAADYSFVGGTNLLSSSMHMLGIMGIRANQWRISIIDALFLRNIILMGVGCITYNRLQNYYTPRLFGKILDNNILHSVRDSYTEARFRAMGFDNVINTGCPTMWRLTKQHCASIPTQKAHSVVFTLTDYRKNPQQDQKLIDTLVKHYAKVYFWPQGSGDYDYLKSFKHSANVTILGGNLWSYDALLQDKQIDLDYVGTRLHAAIRALQNKRRAITLGIDNRAIEKSKDFNLPMLLRDEIEQLDAVLNNKLSTDLSLNTDNINIWKNQFKA